MVKGLGSWVAVKFIKGIKQGCMNKKTPEERFEAGEEMHKDFSWHLAMVLKIGPMIKF